MTFDTFTARITALIDCNPKLCSKVQCPLYDDELGCSANEFISLFSAKMKNKFADAVKMNRESCKNDKKK